MPRKLEYNAKISQRIDISPGLAIFRVVPDESLFAFKPGQYSVLGLKRKEARAPGSDPDVEESQNKDPEEMILRAYSIASSSVDKEFVEFYVAQVESGELTPRLFNLKNGDPLYLGPKAAGIFTLDQVPQGQHVFLIATGTGLAPYISMVRTQLRDHPDRLFVVLHGARHSWDLGYRDELNSLARYFPNLKYFPSISNPKGDVTWKGLAGRVQIFIENDFVEQAIGRKITPDDFHIFLCGNPAMIETVIAMMEERGFRKGTRQESGNIHIEEYW
ncbi:MAG: ferredoxin--NADP reductase [Candidatus Omnitrophota bacterium]